MSTTARYPFRALSIDTAHALAILADAEYTTRAALVEAKRAWSLAVDADARVYMPAWTAYSAACDAWEAAWTASHAADVRALS